MYDAAFWALALPSVGVLLWAIAHPEASFLARLAFALVSYALFTPSIPSRSASAPATSLYPVLAADAGERCPYSFLAVRDAIVAAHAGHLIGVLPLGEALVLIGLLLYVLPWGRTPKDRDRLALLAGAALAYVTAAIPLQLDNEWITVSWALEAAALAWLFRKLKHPGLLLGVAALGLAVVVRLSLNPAVFAYHTRAARGRARYWEPGTSMPTLPGLRGGWPCSAAVLAAPL